MDLYVKNKRLEFDNVGYIVVSDNGKLHFYVLENTISGSCDYMLQDINSEDINVIAKEVSDRVVKHINRKFKSLNKTMIEKLGDKAVHYINDAKVIDGGDRVIIENGMCNWVYKLENIQFNFLGR